MLNTQYIAERMANTAILAIKDDAFLVPDDQRDALVSEFCSVLLGKLAMIQPGLIDHLKRDLAKRDA